MCSGRSGVQRLPGRVSLLHLALDAGGQHRASRSESVAVVISDAMAQDQHSSLSKIIRWRTGFKNDILH